MPSTTCSPRACAATSTARAIAPWQRLAYLARPRPRSLALGTLGSLAVLWAGGAALAAGSLAAHIGEFRALNAALAPGLIGTLLLLLAQLAYVPNAVGWAVCYALGPGFAVGAGTVVAPTGLAGLKHNSELGGAAAVPHGRPSGSPSLLLIVLAIALLERSLNAPQLLPVHWSDPSDRDPDVRA